MRVVWITHNYPRFAGDVAGNFLHPLAVALRARGVDVRVVAPSDGGEGGHDDLDGVPIARVRYGTATEERLAYRGSMAGAWRSPGAIAALVRLTAALRAGAREWLSDGARDRVVHAHWWIPSGIAAPRGVPLVLTCHGTDVRLIDRLPPLGWWARRIMRRAAVVTTVSHALAEIMDRRLAVAVSPDDVQPMPVAELDRPWTDRTGGVVVIGRLTRQKRVDLAIEAFAQAHRADAGLTRSLTIVGDGPEQAALERRVIDAGLEPAVRFTGAIAPGDVPVVLASATCCLMPARDEGFGLAAAEALMQGVPVVVCDDGGGLGEVIEGGGKGGARGGRSVRPQAQAIAAAMLELLRDPGAATSAALVGQAWRHRLAPGFVADRCIDWYARALHA